MNNALVKHPVDPRRRAHLARNRVFRLHSTQTSRRIPTRVSEVRNVTFADTETDSRFSPTSVAALQSLFIFGPTIADASLLFQQQRERERLSRTTRPELVSTDVGKIDDKSNVALTYPLRVSTEAGLDQSPQGESERWCPHRPLRGRGDVRRRIVPADIGRVLYRRTSCHEQRGRNSWPPSDLP